MNTQQYDILLSLAEQPYVNQRELAQISGHSLGIVNQSLKALKCQGYLDGEIRLTAKARQELREKAPVNAVILAAGFGMRMVPINTETPKGLLEVKGERLIERVIRQLHEASVREIYIVTGFMKEKYEYLIDRFHVKLIVNSEYTLKNNLHSLQKVSGYLSNTYIIPCDIWCRENPFSHHELYSWYMVSDAMSLESNVRINRKRELVPVTASQEGNSMIGISYLLSEQSEIVKENVLRLSEDRIYDNAFWEAALYRNHRIIIPAKLVSSSDMIEINTYEQLRDLDSGSDHLKSDAIAVIAEALHARSDEITGITTLKKGMTNRSFLFTCKNRKYIMRIPGEGTGQLINRRQEASVYQVIKGKGICDNNIYINPENGYKITEYMENSRVCNPYDQEDLLKCMQKLRAFHEMNLTVEHEFNLFEQIRLYESFRGKEPSVYQDYIETRENVFSLKPYIDSHAGHRSLTHIDAVPDNFLFTKDAQGGEQICLIDWEYAGMQDPHVDLAMFCIYAMYDRPQIDELIQIYFEGACPPDIRIKIYCYIAACGLLWSNWCEYKRLLGVDFGEYSLKQYRYAKEYYRIVCGMSEINISGKEISDGI